MGLSVLQEAGLMVLFLLGPTVRLWLAIGSVCVCVALVAKVCF